MKKMWMSLLAAVAMIAGSAAGYAAETSKAEPVLLPGVPDKNWFTDYRQALARRKPKNCRSWRFLPARTGVRPACSWRRKY